MSVTSWFLVSSGGTRHRLPREMIFVGRDDCELMLQSRSVDKQHAVINYDASTDEHLVKDLGSLNGTFVNDVRIPEQTYITLKLEDKLRFGYDTNLFTVVRGEMRVPEEALKHEKFTIQLQLSQKSSESELSKSACAKSIDSKVADSATEVQHKPTEALKSEEKVVDTSAMPRGTPLYGQPSWWGDDEADEQRPFKSNGKPEEKNHETGTSGCSVDAKQVEEQSAAANEEVLFPFCREPSYFEIPTKEFQQPSQITESTIHEIPTKDTPSSHTTGAGHASFTIEFDDSTPGKVTIRDHVTKFTSDQRHKSKKSSPGTQDLPGIQTGMMAPENKVADWLAQNNPPQMVWERTEEDSKSIKSDVPVYLKRLKGNKHDDGTQSDSENAGAHRRCSKRATLEEHLRRHHSEQKKLQKAQATEKHQDQAVVSQTAFMIAFFDEDNPRKRRSYSFTQSTGILCQETTYSAPHTKLEKTKSPTADAKVVSLSLQTSSAHHRGGHGVPHGKLLKQKSEEPSVSIPFLQTALLRSSGSLGHRPSQEMDKMLKNQATSAASEKDNDDDQSDKGTYTIELENPNSEEVEARKMIDKVFGVDDNQDYNRPIINEKHKDLIKDWALSSAAVVMEERKLLSTPGFHNSEEGTSSSGNKRWVSQWASLAANHTRHDQEERIMELSVPVPLEHDTDISESGISLRSTGSAASLASQGERRRRTLPQLPSEEKSLESSRTKVIAQRSEIGEKQDTELQEKEAPTQETYSCKSHGRTPLTSTDEHAHSKLEGSKVTKSKTSPGAPGSSSKSTTLPRPRPTRTSLLRRARLGEASDSELADADKASVASEVSTTSSTSKPPTGRRSISRIDLLAQPRRTRLGSLSARSDSEATISRSSASSRTAEAIIRSGARLVPSDKFSPRIRANSISRLSDSKVKSMTSAHGSPSVNSRWRRFPTDYASTSEDEFGSNRNSPKHTRLRTSPALKTTRLQSSGSAMPTSSSFKHRIKEQEDYIRDWTAHREEIARISQDLALIAREINDVAGEIDSVTSSGTAPSTTVSTAATTPGSAIDTREEVGDLHGEMHKLVDRVFDESLNFRKIPPLVHSKTPEGNNCRSSDPRPQPAEPPDHLTITRRRTWSRDEVMGDNLLLSSVFQFSKKIRQSIDKTAGKIRILFKDKDRNWDEIESKLRAESEVPIVKTSSMEISSILQELKRVEKQLQAINAMIDPDGTLEALNNMGFPSAILPSPPKQKSSPVNDHGSPGQTPTLCQPEARVLHPAAGAVSAEFENAESEADFSIHFNRFNPEGEEEDVTVQE
ncbi:centrosomal protein of 170 kDa isoform X11 [Cervus elaphus]|uniref:centrosomal protein of 170 kDa isoform X11 n=1 Tax=Cervus canadensis TaxID=1574408 RepID=UPI001C9E3AFC|nr:centrosomal protein of 170 kDa isoform X11 [Cervus canadensis]XP_043779952.1 centrosomal protein of 170 kDa isoform X11 [Cervus elaphus]